MRTLEKTLHMNSNKLLFFSAIVMIAMMGFTSCSEETDCGCKQSTADSYKKGREAGYPNPDFLKETPECKTYRESLKGYSIAERKEEWKKQKECPGQKAFEKERQLYEDYANEKIEGLDIIGRANRNR